ncbi:hypothetical protein HDV00_002020 [Rhizophlyctis rosea]|nr:hypothetical protein HDV00_002020 [Rhizophlyctis rosea]
MTTQNSTFTKLDQLPYAKYSEDVSDSRTVLFASLPMSTSHKHNESIDFIPTKRYRMYAGFAFAMLTGAASMGWLGYILYWMRIEDAYMDAHPELDRTSDPHIWPHVIIPWPLVFFSVLSLTPYVATVRSVGVRLGFFRSSKPTWYPKAPSPRRFVCTDPHWIGVEDPYLFVKSLKERKTEYRFVGTVYDSDDDDKEHFCWAQMMDIQRWEDRTDERDWEEIEDILRGRFMVPSNLSPPSSHFPTCTVLKLRIRTSHTLESDTLRHRLDALTAEFNRTYLEKEPDLKERLNVKLEDYRTHTQGIAVLSDFDDLDEESGTSGNFVHETTLYLYRGSKRPWWTSGAWFGICSILYLGLLWEVLVGYRGYGVKKLDLKRALF